MKNFKKLFSVILVVAMVSTALIACGMKATPEESTKIYLNALLKNDKTGIDKIGMKEDDIAKLKKDEEDQVMKFFESSGISSSVLTDEVKNNFKDNLFEGMSKVDFEVTPDSTDKDTAKVNVKVKVFDMDKIIKDDQDKLKAEFLANPKMTQTEIYQESFKLVGESFANGTFKDEDKTVKVTLNKKDNIWVLADGSEKDVLNAMVGK